MPPTIIEVRNLRKAYGSVVAADDISFQVQPGEIFGLLGPNGAGTTPPPALCRHLQTGLPPALYQELGF